MCEWRFLTKGEKEVNSIAIKLDIKNTIKLAFWITEASSVKGLEVVLRY